MWLGIKESNLEAMGSKPIRFTSLRNAQCVVGREGVEPPKSEDEWFTATLL